MEEDLQALIDGTSTQLESQINSADSETKRHSRNELDPLETIRKKLVSKDQLERNYQRHMEELEETRFDQSWLRNRNFEERLSYARDLVQAAPLIHTTREKEAARAILDNGIQPAQSLPNVRTKHMPVDERLGLDNFVFATVYHSQPGFEGKEIELSRNVLEQEGTMFSLEDIAFVRQRIASQYKDRMLEAADNKAKKQAVRSEKRRKEVQQYKEQLMPGDKLENFLSHFIATHYQNAEHFFLDNKGRPDIKHECSTDRKWCSPEVKVYGGVEEDDIEGIVPGDPSAQMPFKKPNILKSTYEAAKFFADLYLGGPVEPSQTC